MNSFSIHGHFYQPPREDPLTGIIPIEASAAPYSNWNERILAECYRPNALLRNFEQISFNIGPTLLNWMERFDPETSHLIVQQDQVTLRRSRFGNAIAQAYNHTILPLGSYQDKITQVYWGISDFTHRFKRPPVGMWLPETAVDYETLQVLSDQGIQFTILAPWQADPSTVDPTHPYLVQLPGRRPITVFFYHSELSARISFEATATMNADVFASDILQSSFRPQRRGSETPQLILLASDGELYGHHQPLREHFLARLVDGASRPLLLDPTTPARWLDEHPAQDFVGIQENSSWSCHHGIARWTGACSCTPGDRQWKVNLHAAIARLTAEIDGAYLEAALPLVLDPWQLRHRYIHVLLGQIRFETLVSEMSRRSLTSEETRRVHLLLEAQRECQRMHTSCGLFFEDFDRIEPQNNVAYAAQAVKLIQLATGIDLETQTAADLACVRSLRSNITADTVFRRHQRRADGFRDLRIGYAE